jgi:hypothetical protein
MQIHSASAASFSTNTVSLRRKPSIDTPTGGGLVLFDNKMTELAVAPCRAAISINDPEPAGRPVSPTEEIGGKATDHHEQPGDRKSAIDSPWHLGPCVFPCGLQRLYSWAYACALGGNVITRRGAHPALSPLRRAPCRRLLRRQKTRRKKGPRRQGVGTVLPSPLSANQVTSAKWCGAAPF